MTLDFKVSIAGLQSQHLPSSIAHVVCEQMFRLQRSFMCEWRLCYWCTIKGKVVGSKLKKRVVQF